jgi:heat shock protein HtpX
MRSIVLLTVLVALFILFGYGIGDWLGAVAAVGIAGAIVLGTFLGSQDRILSACGAERVDCRDLELLGLVAETARQCGVAFPRVYLTQEAQPNAFALGYKPENAALILSRGILDTLDREELAGVIAHELEHIRCRDTITDTITAALVSGVLVICGLLGLIGLAAHRSGGWAAITLGIAGGFAVVILRFAIGREREYAADLGAALKVGSNGLIRALRKIDAATHAIDNETALAHPQTASMYFASPFPNLGFGWLFASHPPIHLRIARLEALRRAA